MKDVSVIITSYNNSHNIEGCLKSIIDQQNKQLPDIEVIVVDSGSTDRTREILQCFKNVKIIYLTELYPNVPPPFSPAIARNVGATYAQGHTFLFTDSDCTVPQDWVLSMLQSFKDSSIGCVIGSREPDIGRGYGTFLRRYDLLLFSNKYTFPKSVFTQETLQQRRPFVLLAANNFGIRANLWRHIGGMKTAFRHPAGEDVLLEIEVLRTGSRILFNPQSIVRHFHPVSFRKLLKRAVQNGEATYLLSRYSDGLISWEVFAVRGHNFPMFQFIGSIGVGFLLFPIIMWVGVSVVVPSLIVGGLLALFLNIQAYKTRTRMRRVLSKQSEGYQQRFSLGVGGLYAFVIGHSILRSISSMSFLWYSLFRTR